MKRVILVALILISALLSGCVSKVPSQTPASPTTEPTIPEGNEATSSYLHKPSGMIFPTTINDFQKVNVHQYDEKGLDVSVGYDLFAPPRIIAATFYIYPAQQIVSIGSPSNVVAAAKDLAAENEFKSVVQTVVQSHPGAKIIEQRDIPIIQAGSNQSGKMATFEYEDVLANKRQDVQSRVYLFCYVGDNWEIEYRFSYPKGFDASNEIERFMQNLRWTLISTPLFEQSSELLHYLSSLTVIENKNQLEVLSSTTY